MYGNNMQLPRLMGSYQDALSRWESIKPVRGRADQNTRPLARRSNNNLTIRQDPETKAVIVRLYNTDIVSYGPDGLIHLEPYGSALTNRVTDCILPWGITTYWRDNWDEYRLFTQVGYRYYHTPTHATIRREAPGRSGWTLVSGAEPVEVPYLNRKEARQALEAVGFHRFEAWLKARIRLGFHYGRGWGSGAVWAPRHAVELLQQGETGWGEIVGKFSGGVSLKTELGALRRAVYSYYTCYETRTIEYFEAYDQLRNALSQIRRAG